MKKQLHLFVLLFLMGQLIFAQKEMDTVFTLKGDTLLGKISLQKEKNKFFFTNDTLKETALNPTDITSFVWYGKENDYERKAFYSLLSSFYELEFGKKDYIKVYSKTVYKTVEEYGSKYFTAKKEYCFFKNGSPFFYKPENHRQIIGHLIQDCPAVYAKFKSKFYKEEDVMNIIIDYNKCGALIKDDIKVSR
jgi:hypothetical protein